MTAPAGETPQVALPDLRDPRFALERELLKLLVQEPHLVAPFTEDLAANDFTHPTYRAVWDAVAATGGAELAQVRDALAALDDPRPLQTLNALAVEPIRAAREPDEGYASAHVYRLQELTAQRRIAELRSKLQRTNPVEQATDYNRMFGELVAVESHRRTLREKAIGVTG